MKKNVKAEKTIKFRGPRKIKLGGDYSQLLIPLVSLLILIIFNLIRDWSFFSIGITENNQGFLVFSGNIISILSQASELAILAMGMTLVTSACGGQDISVGAAAAIAGSVFVKILKSGGEAITPQLVIGAFIACCVVAVLCGAFNGILVAVFNIQPMIATLILFTAGRSIAYWINGGATPTVESPIISALGGFIPGVPIPTPVIIVAVCGVIFALLFKFTNLGLYTQAVGINFRAARLNGINTTWIKLLSFMILGVCCAVAGCIAVGRLGLINHETLLLEIEMDAILAVAIGGNALGGGKFKMAGTILGAYAIQTLQTTLYAMRVSSTSIKAYKAVVIIIIVLLGSPMVKEAVNKLKLRLASRKKSAIMEGE
jgi:simple sugar transport system permease protein